METGSSVLKKRPVLKISCDRGLPPGQVIVYEYDPDIVKADRYKFQCVNCTADINLARDTNHKIELAPAFFLHGFNDFVGYEAIDVEKWKDEVEF